jgi:hypothetical protein
MAKIKLGALVGQVSGSVGAGTFSHNRFGPYIRLRTIPVQPDSGLQLAQRDFFANMSSAWSGIGATNQLSWRGWAQNNPIVDSLGDKRVLSGHMAYVSLNARLKQIALPTFNTPPTKAAPTGLNTFSITASVASQLVTLAFTPSPLWSGGVFWIRGCKVPYASINYVKNRLRFVEAAAPGGATPYDCAAVATRLGALTLNEIIVLWVARLDSTTGLISPPLEARCGVGA